MANDMVLYNMYITSIHEMISLVDNWTLKLLLPMFRLDASILIKERWSYGVLLEASWEGKVQYKLIIWLMRMPDWGAHVFVRARWAQLKLAPPFNFL